MGAERAPFGKETDMAEETHGTYPWSAPGTPAVWEAAVAVHLAEYSLRSRFHRDAAVDAAGRLRRVGRDVQDPAMRVRIAEVLRDLEGLPDVSTVRIEKSIQNLKIVMAYLGERFKGSSRFARFVESFENGTVSGDAVR